MDLPLPEFVHKKEVNSHTAGKPLVGCHKCLRTRFGSITVRKWKCVQGWPVSNLDTEKAFDMGPSLPEREMVDPNRISVGF